MKASGTVSGCGHLTGSPAPLTTENRRPRPATGAPQPWEPKTRARHHAMAARIYRGAAQPQQQTAAVCRRAGTPPAARWLNKPSTYVQDLQQAQHRQQHNAGRHTQDSPLCGHGEAGIVAPKGVPTAAAPLAHSWPEPRRCAAAQPSAQAVSSAGRGHVARAGAQELSAAQAAAAAPRCITQLCSHHVKLRCVKAPQEGPLARAGPAPFLRNSRAARPTRCPLITPHQKALTARIAARRRHAPRHNAAWPLPLAVLFQPSSATEVPRPHRPRSPLCAHAAYARPPTGAPPGCLLFLQRRRRPR